MDDNDDVHNIKSNFCIAHYDKQKVIPSENF